jgi:exodeoxyribonuclease-3
LYALKWFQERLTSYAKTLLESGAPIVLAGDFNVMPSDLDVYAPERWVDDAPRCATPIAVLSRGAGATRCASSTPDGSTRSGNISRTPLPATPGCAIDHQLLSPSLAGPGRRRRFERDVRAHDHASDHAPVWIELPDANAGSARPAPRRRKARSG